MLCPVHGMSCLGVAGGGEEEVRRVPIILHTWIVKICCISLCPCGGGGGRGCSCPGPGLRKEGGGYPSG